MNPQFSEIYAAVSLAYEIYSAGLDFDDRFTTWAGCDDARFDLNAALDSGDLVFDEDITAALSALSARDLVEYSPTGAPLIRCALVYLYSDSLQWCAEYAEQFGGVALDWAPLTDSRGEDLELCDPARYDYVINPGDDDEDPTTLGDLLFYSSPAAPYEFFRAAAHGESSYR